MPTTEQDKTLLPNIVEAFTLAFVEICQTYEHQNKINSVSFAKELNLRIANLPDDSNGKMKKTILANMCKVLEGQPYSSGSLFETYDPASRKVA
jgi:hypothetical protein